MRPASWIQDGIFADNSHNWHILILCSSSSFTHRRGFIRSLHYIARNACGGGSAYLLLRLIPALVWALSKKMLATAIHWTGPNQFSHLRTAHFIPCSYCNGIAIPWLPVFVTLLLQGRATRQAHRPRGAVHMYTVLFESMCWNLKKIV